MNQPTQGHRPAHILVIDDDHGVRLMLRSLLEAAGYQIVEAVDGKKGLMQLRERPADLVITDIVMPKMEGLETIREIKRGFPDVRIIVVSGSPGYLPRALEAGADRAFPKPFSRDELLCAVEGLLQTE